MKGREAVWDRFVGGHLEDANHISAQSLELRDVTDEQRFGLGHATDDAGRFVVHSDPPFKAICWRAFQSAWR